MISYIKGEIAEKLDGKIVIETNGVGFGILCSNTTLTTTGMIGEICKLYTYMQVREDDISLIGFSSLEEKNLFEQLISINGIGAKMALSILSGMALTDLVVAIASEDSIALSRIKGLGKKTAERIVLELHDKISPSGITPLEQGFIIDNDDAIEGAYQVLLSLGLTKNEAMQLARANSKDTNSAEEIVSKALRNMGK